MSRFWISVMALLTLLFTVVIPGIEAGASVSSGASSSLNCAHGSDTGLSFDSAGVAQRACDSSAHWKSSIGATLVSYAQSEINSGPYVFGGGNPSGPSSAHGSSTAGFDCTGLALYAIYRATGLNGFNATANGRAVHGYGFQAWLASQPGVTSVGLNSPLVPGDVVIFDSGSHVAIYAGGGKIVQADIEIGNPGEGWYFPSGVGNYSLSYETGGSGGLQITAVLRFAVTASLPVPTAPTTTSGVTRDQIKNHVLWVAATGTAYFADSIGGIHWIPDVLTYDYYRAQFPNVMQLTQAEVNKFGNGQPWATRQARRQDAENKILVVSATGTSYYVDGSGTLHWIPSVAIFNCIASTVPVLRGLTQAQVNELGNGQPWATCASSSPPSSGSAPPPPSSVSRSISIAWSSSHAGWITMDLNGYPPGAYTYTCAFASGGNASFTVTVSSDPQFLDNGHTCEDGDVGDVVWVTIGSVSSNKITVAGSAPSPPPSATTYLETVGGDTHTWTNYANAGGSEGATIASTKSVQVTCRISGFAVADGDTWWYRIASSPWSNIYWASADAFYNNGATSGSLAGTPYYDPAVPIC